MLNMIDQFLFPRVTNMHGRFQPIREGDPNDDRVVLNFAEGVDERDHRTKASLLLNTKPGFDAQQSKHWKNLHQFETQLNSVNDDTEPAKKMIKEMIRLKLSQDYPKVLDSLKLSVKDIVDLFGRQLTKVKQTYIDLAKKYGLTPDDFKDLKLPTWNFQLNPNEEVPALKG